MTSRDGETLVHCSCEAVALTLRGEPMMTVTCCCDTCQEGSRRIEALPDAPPVREADGGTAYTLYRKDRISYVKGSALLKDYQLEQHPKTSRVVASCCNSAMLMRFDGPMHWVCVYRTRLGADAPAIQMRICTACLPENAAVTSDVPSYRGYAPAFMLKLLSSRLAMLFGS